MKSLIVELVYFISLFIAANMIYFDIYPQYHGFCIDWLILGCFGGYNRCNQKDGHSLQEKESL